VNGSDQETETPVSQFLKYDLPSWAFACVDGKPRRLGANDAVQIRKPFKWLVEKNTVPTFQWLVEKNTYVTQLHFGGHPIVLQTERKVVNVKRTYTDALSALCHIESGVVYARGNCVPFRTLKVFTLGRTSPLGPVHFHGRVSRVEVKTFRFVLVDVQRKRNNQAVPVSPRHFKTDF